MKRIEQKYHDVVRANNVLAICMGKARRRFPGEKLSFCGYENCWEDCLTGFEIDGKLSCLFYFNVGNATHATKHEVRL